MNAGGRMAVLKLDLSLVLRSDQAHGKSGTAGVFLSLRGKLNCGEKGLQALTRQREKHSILILKIFLKIFLYFLLLPTYCTN